MVKIRDPAKLKISRPGSRDPRIRDPGIREFGIRRSGSENSGSGIRKIRDPAGSGFSQKKCKTPELVSGASRPFRLSFHSFSPFVPCPFVPFSPFVSRPFRICSVSFSALFSFHFAPFSHLFRVLSCPFRLSFRALFASVSCPFVPFSVIVSRPLFGIHFAFFSAFFRVFCASLSTCISRTSQFVSFSPFDMESRNLVCEVMNALELPCPVRACPRP